MTDERPLYERVGGHTFFVALVDGFYTGVAQDPLLREMYPEEDLAPAAERLRMFLEQYWGGPRTYSEQRGHPKLRARHLPFTIDEAARDAWLRHMLASLDALVCDAASRNELHAYLVSAADFMINAPEPGVGRPLL
jgi:hemoglobin